VQLMATQQPMARDLRNITASLIIAKELERMADHAQGIAKINVMMGDEPLLKPLVDVPRMAAKGVAMTHEALDAFVRGDVELAKQVAKRDDDVDALYDQVYRELLTFMLNDPHTISRATWLLWVAHNLERVADRTKARARYESGPRLSSVAPPRYFVENVVVPLTPATL